MKTAVVILTDAGFLVPSLVLAGQIANDPRYAKICDVLLFLIDLDLDLAERASEAVGSSRVIVQRVTSGDIGLPVGSSNFAGHVPVSCLARLAMSDLLPSDYGSVVYLDGDVRVVGDIEPLLTLEVADGQIAACAENFILVEGRRGDRPEWLGSILGKVGLTTARDYFNSGVMAFNRQTWAALGPEAMRYYKANEEFCQHHDQSALNAVLAGRWQRLPLGYNFQSFFQSVISASGLDKRLLHFSSSPKPWSSPRSVWPTAMSDPYREFAQRFPELGKTLSVYDAAMKPGEARSALRQARRLLGNPRRQLTQADNLSRYVSETRFIL